MCLVSSTSVADSWGFSLVNAGIYNAACIEATESAISKLWLASTTSPESSFLSIPQCSVRYLSLTQPPQASEINATVPCGSIPMRSFAVFQCL